MVLDIDEKNLKHGVLGLVLALVEIIKDALRTQAIRRMEGGSLTEEEVERLGRAMMDLDKAIEQIKEEQGVGEAVQSVRDGLDDLVDDVIDAVVNPQRWKETKV
ncbi:MAG: gas vesicle protein K [Candidatus Binatia bacterium]